MTQRATRRPTPAQLQALLGEHLQRHPAPSPDLLDDAELQRVMQRLQARRTAASAPLPVSPAPRPGSPGGHRAPRALLSHWLGGWAPPLAAALGALLMVIWQPGPDETDAPPTDWQSKGGSIPWPSPDAALPAQGERWLPTSQPAQDAQALAAALRAAGATVQVSGSGAERLLQASAPEAAQAAVAQVLADWGLAPATDGYVVVRLSWPAP